MLWAATKMMMGLNYADEQIDQLVEGVGTMILGIRGIEESSVYQSIFAKCEAQGKAEGEAKGEAKGIVESLLRVGRKRLGAPDERVEAAIRTITDPDQLLRLVDRVEEVTTWDALARVGAVLIGPPSSFRALRLNRRPMYGRHVAPTQRGLHPAADDDVG